MQPLIGPLTRLNPNDSEVESLQTDVMRFLAIIALCLLAVFAAVSSEMPQSVREMIDVQDNMIAALQDDTEAAMQQNTVLESQLAQRNEQLLNAQMQLSARSQPLQTDSSLSTLQAEIAALEDQLQHADRKQAELNQQASAERRHRQVAELEIQRLQNELRATTADLMAQRQQAEPVDETEAPVQLQRLEPPQVEFVEVTRAAGSPETVDTTPVFEIDEAVSSAEEAPPPVETTPAERPLTLSFESDAALLTLLNSGRVQLLALASSSVWRYQPFNETFVAITIADSVNIISQVPAQIDSLAASRIGQADIRWGVLMDESMRSSLAAIISSVDSGDILVNAQGDFKHRP